MPRITVCRSVYGLCNIAAVRASLPFLRVSFLPQVCSCIVSEFYVRFVASGDLLKDSKSFFCCTAEPPVGSRCWPAQNPQPCSCLPFPLVHTTQSTFPRAGVGLICFYQGAHKTISSPKSLPPQILTRPLKISPHSSSKAGYRLVCVNPPPCYIWGNQAGD